VYVRRSCGRESCLKRNKCVRKNSRVPANSPKEQIGNASSLPRARKPLKRTNRSRKKPLACLQTPQMSKSVTQGASRVPKNSSNEQIGHARSLSRAKKLIKRANRSRKKPLACPETLQKNKSVTQEASSVPKNSPNQQIGNASPFSRTQKLPKQQIGNASPLHTAQNQRTTP
jgi:hypothetical protein